MLRIILKTTTGLAFGFGIGIASAQSLRDAGQPAEFPPASYTAKQYVDSKGCVFVRAGFDGAITWVPRVNRKRNVVCGFSPTFAKNTKPAPAPRVVAAPAPVVTAPRRVAPVVQPRRVVTAAPVPRVTAPARVAPVRVVAAPAVRATAPTQLTRIPVAPSGVATACPGASALSQKYLVSSTHKIRCGPQGTPVVAGVAGASRGVVRDGSTPATAIRVEPAPAITPPPGYRAAFNDDRFNPNRGLGTREGHAQMRLIWTSGVPRRLVDQNTRRDVTSLFPGLRFPFISLRQQKKYVAVNGWPASSGVTSSTVVSSKNIPATAPVQVPAGHRFVQVGTFRAVANAQTSAARLKGLGLPVRIAAYKKNGKTYNIVMAGPFASAGQLQNGLTAARRAGFLDAFTRK